MQKRPIAGSLARDDMLVARARARAAALGKPIGQVLDEAGLDPHYLLRRAEKGRRLDALEALAGALDWTLSDLVSPAETAARWLGDTSALAALLAVAAQRHGMAEVQRLLDLAKDAATPADAGGPGRGPSADPAANGAVPREGPAAAEPTSRGR